MMKRKKTSIKNYITYAIALGAFAVMMLLIATGNATRHLQSMLVPICINIVLAASLNLVVGVLGELSLGHAGFMSVGAFTGIVATTFLADAVPSPVLRLTVAMILAAVAAAIVGVIVGIPVLRLKGDYLAIVTLAFGEIIKNIINVLYVGMDDRGLHFSIIKQTFTLDEGGDMIINGPIGVSGIDKISNFTAGFILILITLFIVLNLINSRHGRAVMAVRDNRIAADSVGISTTRFKLMAFVISAAFAGMAGTLYAMNYSTITAAKFDFNLSILVLVFVVLGGLGNIWGSIIAAALLTVLPELLRALNFNDYRMLVYAILLIVLMLFNNSGAKEKFLGWLALRKEAKGHKQKKEVA